MRMMALLAVPLVVAACSTTQTAAASSSGLSPRGPVIEGVPVTRVVDGDTIRVELDGRDVTVRLVGIDTPETVRPDSPVECYGPEASAFATSALAGREVTIEFDDGQGRTDRFDRTLAYVWVDEPGGLSLFNLVLVAGGYAREQQYGDTPPVWKPELREAEIAARDAGLGLWDACGRPGS